MEVSCTILKIELPNDLMAELARSKSMLVEQHLNNKFKSKLKVSFIMKGIRLPGFTAESSLGRSGLEHFVRNKESYSNVEIITPSMDAECYEAAVHFAGSILHDNPVGLGFAIYELARHDCVSGAIDALVGRPGFVENRRLRMISGSRRE
jgi:hypothetical protein